MRAKLTSALFVAFVVLQHFQIARVGTFGLTLGVLLGVALFLICVKRTDFQAISLTWVVVVALTALAALAAPRIVSASNYFSTLGLVLVSSAILASSRAGIRSAVLQSSTFKRAVFVSLVIVTAFSVLQTLTGSLGSEALFNPWGSFQYQHQYMPYVQFNAYPRAQGFYLEPSYDAFIIGSLAVLGILLGLNRTVILVIALAGMAACQSATGLILLVILAVVMAVRSKPSSAVPVFLASILLLAALGNYLSTRLLSINSVGSSANYRLVAPLRVMEDVLTKNPLGLPLGSIYDVIQTYGLQMDGVDETVSLDNGVYVIVYYFGWIGLIACIALALWVARSFVTSKKMVRNPNNWIGAYWAAGSLLFSGGIVAVEYATVLFFILSAYNENKEPRGNDDQANRLYNHHHVQRPKRTISNAPVSGSST